MILKKRNSMKGYKPAPAPAYKSTPAPAYKPTTAPAHKPTPATAYKLAHALQMFTDKRQIN